MIVNIRNFSILFRGKLSCEFQSVKTLEDVDFLKHQEIATIAKIELELIRSGISKKLIIFFKKLIISNKCLHLISEEQLKKYIMLNYC